MDALVVALLVVILGVILSLERRVSHIETYCSFHRPQAAPSNQEVTHDRDQDPGGY